MISKLSFVDKGDGISLRDSVYLELKDAIMKGELLPGMRLMEIPIADKMGVSRTPVREAIKRLEKDGFVTVTPGFGAKVSGIGDKDVTDALDVRIAVETMAVRQAAQVISAKQVEELRRINRDIHKAVKSGDVAAISLEDNRLHHTICEISDNKVLLRIMQELEELVLRFRVEYIKGITEYSAILEDHDAIIDAVAAGDADEAARLVESHITRQRDYICEIINKGSE